MNAYFICVIVHVQMCFVYAQLLDDQTQKDFWVVYLFLKVFFCITYVLKIFPKSRICFFEKLSYKHFRECFMSKVSFTQFAKMKKWISNSSKFLHRESYDSLASHSRETTSCETCLVHIWGISWETRKSLASTYSTKWADF